MMQLPEAPTTELPPVWYDEKSPEVSVIILNYNKPDLTQSCLEHLWAYTSDRRYEIIVVDNGSSPENVEPLRSITGPFRLIRLEVNRFFGEGNNIGAEAALGAYVVFLNNDAFVTAGWLDPLVRRMEEQPLFGGIGPLFLYPDGRVQEAGAFVGADGDAVQIGKFRVYSPDDISVDHVVDYVSAACFLMRRDLFLTVGGFEYTYEPAYYEDVDLCLKIATRGMFISYCAESRVIHMENATSSAHREKLGLHNIIEINRAQLLNIWGTRLEARELKAVKAGPARPLSRRPRAIFYTPYDITPGGGERYLLTAAAALLTDFDVHLVTEETYSRTRIGAIARDLSLDVHGIELVERRNLHRLGPIDISILMSNEALPPFAGFAPHNLYICQFPFPQTWSEDLRRFGNLNTFARTIVYSAFVRDNLQRKRSLLGVGIHPVEIIAPPVPLAPRGSALAPLAPPFRIVLVGRFFAGGHNKRHDIAIEAVRRLIKRGLPVELDVVGSLSPHAAHRNHYVNLLAMSEGMPITFYPNATPAALHEIFARSHLYIHAAGYGVDTNVNPHECEHFGISVVEAMSYGLAPFVVANGGPVSVVQEGLTGYTYSSVEELVAKIETALGALDELAAVRNAAVATATNYDEQIFGERWRAAAAELTG
jgi:GT2 family glycosyltransferase/glycosyltransferase involved in cell wall biosynthesis